MQYIETFTLLRQALADGMESPFQILLSPEMARDITAKYPSCAKIINQNEIKSYARMLKDGNIDSEKCPNLIEIDADGKICKGNSLLHAIMLSGETMVGRFAIAENREPVASSDSNRKYGRKKAIAEYLAGHRMPTTELNPFIDWYRDAFEYVLPLFPEQRRNISVVPVIAAFIKAFYHIPNENLSHYAEVLLNGSSGEKSDQPILMLCNKLNAIRQSVQQKAVIRMVDSMVQRAIYTAMRNRFLKSFESSTQEYYMLPEMEGSHEEQK